MYIRFAIEHVNPDSHHREGLFQAVWRLEEDGELPTHEVGELDDLLAWFGQHLSRPDRLARSRRPRAHPAAICWFKPTAHDHIRRMHRIAAIFRRQGVPVAILTTRRPGYIVYEDAAQVAAQPFRDTRA